MVHTINMVPAMDALEFDEASHVYRQHGRKVPGVTEVLQKVGIIDTTWFTEYARWRGSAVHMACQFHDEGTLDYADLDPTIRPYLDAYCKFRDEWSLTVEKIETPVIHRDGLFAGTPDRVGHGERQELTPVVVDLKSGEVPDWAALQLAAYSELAGAIYRVGVQLKPDGTYAMRDFPVKERRKDYATFLGALAVFNWRELHK